jgi:hypothetical protein
MVYKSKGLGRRTPGEKGSVARKKRRLFLDPSVISIIVDDETATGEGASAKAEHGLPELSAIKGKECDNLCWPADLKRL